MRDSTVYHQHAHIPNTHPEYVDLKQAPSALRKNIGILGYHRGSWEFEEREKNLASKMPLLSRYMRLWFGEISLRIYSPKDMTIEVNRKAIEHNRKAIERNRTQSNFPKFSISDWHSIDSINQISIVRLRSIVFD